MVLTSESSPFLGEDLEFFFSLSLAPVPIAWQETRFFCLSLNFFKIFSKSKTALFLTNSLPFSCSVVVIACKKAINLVSGTV